jgi:hypothetical protein
MKYVVRTLDAGFEPGGRIDPQQQPGLVVKIREIGAESHLDGPRIR